MIRRAIRRLHPVAFAALTGAAFLLGAARAPIEAAPADQSPLGTIVSATSGQALLPPARPRLALVLSGGGARGAAHVGVLKVLEEHHIVPDLIVGTSMGSIIGGLYASGWTPEEIEQLFLTTDWGALFSDQVEREDKTYRRRLDDDLYLIQARIRFKGWKPWLPRGVLGGQRINLFMQGIEYASTGERDFDNFPVPYRAVATDLVSGETVVIGEGSLAAAMRASMAVPGVFAPVEMGGRSLVDGGAVANLPVRVAHALGAERVIAVDITTPLAESQAEITSFLSVLDQNSTFLTAGNRLLDIANLAADDIYIKPELGDIGFMNFKRAAEAIGSGEAAARTATDRLRGMGADAAAWESFRSRHHRRPGSERVVNEVVVRNEAPINDGIVRRRVEVPLGGTITPETFPEQIIPLRALEYFGPIDTEFHSAEGRGTLTLRTTRAPYGKNLLQLGLNLNNDFAGEAGYALTVRHQLLGANRKGGEWQNILQGGTASTLSTEFYQPFDDAMRWFVAPRAEYRRFPRDIWIDGDKVAEYTVKSRQFRLDGGRVLGDWGEIRLGAGVGHSEGALNVGSPVLPDFDERLGEAVAEFHVDTRDSTMFTRHGTSVDMIYGHNVEWLGADAQASRAFLAVQQSYRLGRGTILPSFEAGTTFKDADTTLSNAYALGGFLRLSGLAPSEIFGTRGGLARLIYFHQLANLELGALSTKAYAGVSLEAGNVYFEDDPVTWSSLRKGGSIFVGAETVIGPAYLAWGTTGGDKRIYLSIGQRF